MNLIKIKDSYLNPLLISQWKIEESIRFYEGTRGYKVVGVLFGKSEVIREFENKQEATDFLNLLMAKVMSNESGIFDADNPDSTNGEWGEPGYGENTGGDNVYEDEPKEDPKIAPEETKKKTTTRKRTKKAVEENAK